MKILNISQLILIVLTVLAISTGQIFFKLAANQMHDYREALRSLVCGWLLISLVVYAIATALWVYTLRSVPLKIAYPFAALAFVFVPVLAHYILGEVIGMRTFAGALFILLGIIVSLS